MIFGVSELMGSPGEGAIGESGGASGGSSEIGGSSSIPEEIKRSGVGGSRWPRKETFALLKIRSDMDAVFRDASHKAPLWEEVSRKMAELGFQRSAKKCREKFENVYKYHKRTKDGRASKPAGKTYRFFEQLEALENNPFTAAPSRPQQPVTAVTPANNSSLQMPSYGASLPTSPTPLSVLPPNMTPPPQISTNPMNTSQFQQPQPLLQPTPATSIPHNFQPSHLHLSGSLLSNSMSSSSTSSDEDIHRRRGRKRKWKDYLQKLMREVIQKQEEMQKRFLETLEKRERDRIAREEAWRVQEMGRLNREHELLAQERSVASAKDAAVVAFLHKITDQQNLQIPVSLPLHLPVSIPQQIPIQVQPASQQQPPTSQQQTAVQQLAEPPAVLTEYKGTADNVATGSSSRWPKTEVQALIRLRTNLDLKYQETGPKGPLWEEISNAMAKLGYNRSSKRCKEKWENINKYYKKVKESSKKRPGDSKTCPYFHQLEAIYKDRTKSDPPSNPPFPTKSDSTMAPIMAMPEQQWPSLQQYHESSMQNQGNVGLNIENEEDDDDDDEDEDDGGGSFDIIPNQQLPSVSTAE